MDRYILLLPFFLVAIVASHAAVPAEVYWSKVLPNTPMPSAIQELLHPDVYVDGKGTAVTVGKGGVNVNTGKGKPGGTTVNVGHGGVGVHTGVGKGTNVNVGHGGVGVHAGAGGKGTNVNVGHGGVGVHTGKGTNVNVGHGGVSVNVPPKKKPVIVHAAGFSYKYSATETQVNDDPTTTLFFLEKDLRPETKMTLHFTRTTPGAPFLPRVVANSIPFSSSKLPEILNHFSIQPETAEADAMKTTLQQCEEPAFDRESKYCATSLESMVEFSTTSLGTSNVQAVSTTVSKKDGTPKQLYTIEASGVQRLPGSNLVVCHAETYAYAVFYCHTTPTTKAYHVALAGTDGTKVEAVAVCHTDTAKWNPKHIAFRALNVKPGTVPVCHFLPQDHLVWSPKK